LKEAGQALLFASAVLTLWSMIKYMQAALPTLVGRAHNS